MSSLSKPLARADEYCRLNQITRTDEMLGQGKDGGVWKTSRASAVKPHNIFESYRTEIVAYIRLHGLGLREIAGFSIPELIGFDDDLYVIEIGVVFPAFHRRLASARLDVDPQLIEDPGNTFEDFVRSRFDDRTDEVMALYYHLIAKAGIYLTDLHPHNIKFAR